MMKEDLEKPVQTPLTGVNTTPTSTTSIAGGGTPSYWGHSSVSTFRVRYTPPLPDLSTTHSVEALVEGSDMSLLREGMFISLIAQFVLNFMGSFGCSFNFYFR